MSQDNPILIPVPFHEDTITCIETPEGVFVAVAPICNRLGIASNTQITRLKADGTRWGGYLIVSPSAGGAQETYCIPLSRLAAWLFSINANRVKPELREGLIQYQREADTVLDRHFRQRAAETLARIEEQERMLWHCHQHILMSDPKWNRAARLKELGSSPYLIAKKCGWSRIEAEQEMAEMHSCGIRPLWRDDMMTVFDRERSLRWENEHLKGKLKEADDQMALFPALFGQEDA
jgi:hypothetical protein